MRSKIVFFFLTLIAVNAFSDFSGRWSGTGTAVDPTTGMQLTCTTMNADISQNQKTITISAVNYSCGDLSSSRYPATLDIVGNYLYFHGVHIGFIEKDYVTAINMNQRIGYRQKFTVQKISDTQVKYFEQWLDGNNQVQMYVEGLMKK